MTGSGISWAISKSASHHRQITMPAPTTQKQSEYITTTTILRLSGFCPGQPMGAGIRRNIRRLTPIIVINHPLSASSIYYDPWYPPCSIYVPDSLFAQSLSKFSLVYLLAWHLPLHTPYISSPIIVFFSHHMPIPLQPVLL